MMSQFSNINHSPQRDRSVQAAKKDERLKVSVSIIIPTKNRYPALHKALKSIAGQTQLPEEVFVIDQSPSSGSWPQLLVEALPGTIDFNYICDPQISGGAEARNLAIDAARGDILLFLDDDVSLHPDFLEKLLMSWSERPNATGISGIADNYSRPTRFYFWWSAVFMRGPFRDDRQPVYWKASMLQEPVQVTRFTGCMMSFRKSAIKGVHFDSNLRGVSDGEDVDFCIRLKGKYFIDPRCKLTHHMDTSGRETTHWTQRHARAQTYLYYRNWTRHKIAFAWLRAGYMLAATLGCLSRRSLDPVRSMIAGRIQGKKACAR